jgi:formate/nitrite transporter FocA (FNT family)
VVVTGSPGHRVAAPCPLRLAVGAAVGTTIGTAVLAAGVRATIGRALTSAAVGATIGTAVVTARVRATVSSALTSTAVGATIGTAVAAAGHASRAAVRWSVAAFVVACFVQGGFGHR